VKSQRLDLLEMILGEFRRKRRIGVEVDIVRSLSVELVGNS